MKSAAVESNRPRRDTHSYQPTSMSPIVIIFAIGGMLIATTVALAALYFSHKRREQWHQTARVALEKGQPLPPAVNLGEDAEDFPPPNTSLADWQAARRAESRSQTVKGALVLIALGAGLQVFLYSVRARVGWIGVIPGFIGVALLLHTVFESLFYKPNSSSRPPQS